MPYGQLEWDDFHGRHHLIDTHSRDEHRRIARTVRKRGGKLTRSRRFG